MTGRQKRRSDAEAHTHLLGLEGVLNERRDTGDVGWPRLCRMEGCANIKGKILLRGDLALDLPIKINMNLGAFVASLRQQRGSFPCEWEPCDAVVGGFVGQMAPIAADLGFEVHINCAAALPSPKPIRTFLECGRYDTRNVVVFPGPTPATLRLRFTDGHMLFQRCGIDGSCDVPSPSRITEDFRIALVKPTSRQRRAAMLDRLTTEVRARGLCSLGVIARGDWEAHELLTLRGTQSWIFFNRAGALDTAKRIVNMTKISDEQEAARLLKSYLDTNTRLVVTLEEDGAYLLNSKTEPQWFPVGRVKNRMNTGAGGALALFATAASALGMSDEGATELGIEASRRWIAGLPLPGISTG